MEQFWTYIAHLSGATTAMSAFETIGAIAFWLGLFEVFPIYLLAMAGWDIFALKKMDQRTVPNRATWLIWAFEGAIVAPANIAAGATSTAGVPVAYEIGYITVALLSLRWGEGGLNRIDLVCIAAAVASGIVGLVSHEPMIAIVIPLIVDFFGAVPTIKKCWLEPEKEYLPAWSLTLLVSCLNFLAIDWGNVTTGALMYPTYMAIVNFAIVAPLYAHRAAKKRFVLI